MTCITGNDWILEINHHTIPLESLHEVDPFWVHMDTHGHYHRWDFTKTGLDKTFDLPDEFEPYLPTLEFIEEFEGTDEYPAEGYWACRQCGERVDPGYRSSPVTRYLKAPSRFYLNKQEITISQARTFLRLHGYDV